MIEGIPRRKYSALDHRPGTLAIVRRAEFAIALMFGATREDAWNFHETLDRLLFPLWTGAALRHFGQALSVNLT